MIKIKGGCLCGKIRYEADAETFLALRRHCRDCQYVSGGEPAAVISLVRGALRIQGEPRAYRSKADSGVDVFRSFCGECGTPLFGGNEKYPEHIAIKLGSLDEPSKFAPAGHIWTSSAQPWHQIDTNAPIVFSKNSPSPPN